MRRRHGVDRNARRERRDLAQPARPDRRRRSALLSTMTGAAPLSHGDQQIALDAARVEVAVEAGDEKHDVDVGGDDLFLGGIAGGAPREAAARAAAPRGCARRRRRRGGSSATQSPTAGKSARAAASWRSRPETRASSSPARREHAVDVRVLEADARRARRRRRAYGAKAAASAAFQPSVVETHGIADVYTARGTRHSRRVTYRPAARLQPGSAAPRRRSTPARRSRAARNGASASKISLIEPTHASSRCASKPVEQLARARAIVRDSTLSQASTNGPISQRPDRALVIRGVARAQIAVVVRLVVRMARRQRPQADRRQQPLAHDLHHRLPARAVEHRMVERDREQLVRPARRIVAVLAVDDVVEIAALLVPEALVERLARALGVLAEIAASSPLAVARAVQPSSRRSALYQSALISTALPRRGVTTQSSDLRVHPGELIALAAPCAQQAVGRIDADAEARARAGDARRCRRSVGSSCAQRLVDRRSRRR